MGIVRFQEGGMPDQNNQASGPQIRLPRVSAWFTQAVIGTAGLITVVFVAFCAAMLSAVCKPYLVLTEYMLAGWLTWLLGIAIAGVIFTLVAQVVAALGPEIDNPTKQAFQRHQDKYHLLNIVFCVAVLFVEFIYCNVMADYFLSAVRALSPACQLNEAGLIWEPPAKGTLWQMGHGLSFGFHHIGETVEPPTEANPQGYEYPHSVAMPAAPLK
jgi:hypothetical protein